MSRSKFKRYNFSLTEAVSHDIDSISLIPRDFKCTRSEVIKSAVYAFKALKEDEKLSILRKICHSENQ